VVLVVSDSTLSANLNTFFPFDPYRLPLSHEWIDPIYREWSTVSVDDEDEEDEEEEESEGDEAKETLSDGLGVSFEAMSISPARAGISAAETS
jgi:RNA polymerase I-specific transcription initiation factor RRN3